MLEKEIVNGIARGTEILALEDRTEIRDDRQGKTITDHLLDQRCRILVAGIDDGAMDAAFCQHIGVVLED